MVRCRQNCRLPLTPREGKFRGYPCTGILGPSGLGLARSLGGQADKTVNWQMPGKAVLPGQLGTPSNRETSWHTSRLQKGWSLVCSAPVPDSSFSYFGTGLPQGSRGKELGLECPWVQLHSIKLEITKGPKGVGKERAVYISDVGFETVLLHSGNWRQIACRKPSKAVCLSIHPALPVGLVLFIYKWGGTVCG